MNGLIHSVESFGAVDGPGLRYVIFCRGCCFRCKYCHNPDTWANDGSSITMSSDDILSNALRFRSYWGKEGGITVSGGEPMLQAEFVSELFEKAHSKGVNTCLDTSGGVFNSDNNAIVRLINASDVVMLDIKHINNFAHKELTGADNDAVLNCAKYISNIGKRIWIRYVLVPGINSDEETLQKTASFIHTLFGVERVDILPYHTLGEYKWRKLGLEYQLHRIPSPNMKLLKKATAILNLASNIH